MDLSVERLKLSDADGEDRLSALPDDLLIHILALVDTAAAARTRILASRWRHLWALLPELSFIFIKHHHIGAALAAHEAPLRFLFALTKDASTESLLAWLPIAARVLSGRIYLKIGRRKPEERGAAIDLPCFEKATSIMLKLGDLGLALPASGVFARLKELNLVDIHLHGQSELGDLLSSQRCPSLRHLRVCNVEGLYSFNIQSDSLVNMELSDLYRLQHLSIMALALERLKVSMCFIVPLIPDLLSVPSISAPQLKSLEWMTVYCPSSIQLDKVRHLQRLRIEIYNLRGEEDFGDNNFSMELLRRFENVHTLDLNILYPLEPTPCPSGCICDQPPNWRTEELALNCLEEIQVHSMTGTEHEVAVVQRLFHWATTLKRMKIVFHESITEIKAMELRQLLVSFSGPGTCMDFNTVVP